MARPRREPRTRSLRARVRDAIALVTVLALLLFGVPLAVVLDRLITTQALTALQRDATRAVAAVPDNTLEAGTPVPVPRGTGDIRIGVYDARGTRVAGVGPPTSALASRAADGHEHDGSDSGELGVVMPVLSDTTVAGSVRAAVPLAQLRAQVYRAWGLLAALALAIIGVAVLFARRAAVQISRPFEQLATATRHLGDGRYDVRLPRWGIAEADAAGDALRDSAREIDTLVSHERAFVRDASHQLRTPLAGVLLFLEQQPPDVAAALTRARDLETTIADLLSLRSPTATGACNPGRIAGEAVRRWTTPDRPVVLRTDHTGDVAITGPALRQSLDVLLDNAVRHGGGTVTVTVEAYGETIVVEVADQGTGFPDDSTPGTGLQLATNLVERAGGSLLIRRRAPRARVALLLPPSRPAPDGTPEALA
ncbi:sensor histidine kinase [Dactylosporangium sp. NPDC048998]|uniref:sensor histidine kinase n=1 Tax=Dactylosporangium sp. NPDC048998 TaxID=3363976 RepID=UPI00372232BA